MGRDIFGAPMIDAPLAVSGYQLGLFIHITAVMVGFGATFAEAIMFPVAMKTGIRGEGDLSFDQTWIGLTFGILIVVGGLLGGYFIPADRRLGPMVERDIEAAGGGDITLSDLSEEYQRGGRLEGITGLLLVVAVYLMVVRPGA
jgi:hypothetical protein